MKNSARHAAYKALIDIEKDNAYSNMALNHYLRDLEPREQALAERYAMRCSKGNIFWTTISEVS